MVMEYLIVVRNESVAASPASAAASPSSPILSSHDLSSPVLAELPLSLPDTAPLATSSPLPSSVPSKSHRVPPPVAPKPILPLLSSVIPQASLTHKTTPEESFSKGEVANPEKFSFGGKLAHFERKIEDLNGSSKNGSATYAVPKKVPLLNADEIKRMKEDEAKKITSFTIEDAATSPFEESAESFLHQLSQERLTGSGGSIRTKKAEQRAIAAGLIEDEYAGLSEAERREKEAQKRAEWRQARYASLATAQKQADALMEAVKPILNNINEDEGNSTRVDENNGSRIEEISFVDD